MSKSTSKLAIFLLLFISLRPLRAQVTAVDIVGSATTVPSKNLTFSPSITEATNSEGDKEVYSAYTFITSDGLHRSVAVSKSTDNGTSWLEPKLFDGSDGSTPIWTGDGKDHLQNLDQPQIIHRHGTSPSSNGVTILVVRAWGSVFDGQDPAKWFVGTDDNGVGDKEQPGSIFLQAGIYISLTSDDGATWGYWKNGAWTTNNWGVIAECPNFGDASHPATVETPRLAWRDDYRSSDGVGYVSWGIRQYNVSSGNHYSLTTGSEIGIRSFGADGKLYPVPQPGDDLFSFSNCSLSGYSFAERPSVAVAPDNTVWLSFYSIAYGGTHEGAWKPKMHIWYAQGTPNSSNHTVNFGCPTELLVGNDKYAFGLYDQKRGFLYAGLHPDRDFDIDIAQGPQIQISQTDQDIASNNCGFVYHVGLVYSTSDSLHQQDVSGAFDYHCQLSFNSARYSGGVLRWKSLRDDLNSSLGDNSSLQDMVIFPTLKYTQCYQVGDPSYPGATLGLFHNPTSYFVIAYLGMEHSLRSGSSDDARHVSELQCEIGVAFDNEHFHINSSSGARHFVEGAAVRTTLNGDVDPYGDDRQNWGSQLDAAGNYALGSFDTHVVWKDVSDGAHPEDWRTLTTTGNCILMRAIQPWATTDDAAAYPQGPIFRWNGDATSTFPWGDDAWFSMDPSTRPFNASAATSVTWKGATLHNSGTGIFPSVAAYNSSSNPIPNGTYYATYLGNLSGSNALGDLGSSDQRKLISTGAVLHAVFEADGMVKYSTLCPNVSYNLAILSGLGSTDWTAPYTLESGLPSGSVSLRPSAAVYQESNGTSTGPWNGAAAIAVTWVDSSLVSGMATYKIQLSVREFNTCTGEWAEWSPVYTIDQHTFAGVGGRTGDYTTPVVAPLILQSGSGFGNDKPTNLLGWTITWISSNTENITESAIYSRTWMRATNDNSQWGSYPPVAPSLLVPIAPSVNMLVSVGNGYPSALDLKPIAFISVTNRENRRDANVDQQVTFSTDGTSQGIWVGNAHYTTSGALYPSSTLLTSQVARNAPAGNKLFEYTYWDRNPDIVVNSSGAAFVAYEHSEQVAISKIWPPTSTSYVYYYSSDIEAAKSAMLAEWSSPSSRVVSLWGGLPMGPSSFQNPSLSAFPKTPRPNDFRAAFDHDPAAVQLMYNLFGGLLASTTYAEDPGSRISKNDWGTPSPAYSSHYATNSQRSFGTRQRGPDGPSGFQIDSYGMGNGWPDATRFFMPEIEMSYKGTLLAHSDFNNYRTEIHQRDSSLLVHFTWGGVAVGDTSSGVPVRQVILHAGDDTTGTFISQKEARDSLFRTEVFDWPVGATISYWRGYLLQDSVLAAWIGSGPTIPPAPNPLQDTSFFMRYLVELVHIDDGSIDTLETLALCPRLGLYPVPGLMTVTNGNLSTRDVYLRVVAAAISGVDPEDSLTTFRLEHIYGNYPADTNFAMTAYRVGSPRQMAESNGLSVARIYPNPVIAGNPMTLTVAYPKGHDLRVTVSDELGREVFHTSVMNTTGDWQRVNIPCPKNEGAYFVHIVGGGSTKSTTFVVLK